MSDTEINNTAGDAETAAGSGGMPQKDVEFLVACLQNTTSGSVSVDTVKVAAAKGYANVRSVSNRIAQLKKKYNLPFGSSAGGAKKGESTPKKASDAAGPTEPAIAATPSKQRVAKPKTPASKKKGTATPKTPANGKKAKKVEEDEDIEDQDELAVMSPKKDDTEDEGVFGKKDSDEEA